MHTDRKVIIMGKRLESIINEVVDLETGRFWAMYVSFNFTFKYFELEYEIIVFIIIFGSWKFKVNLEIS